MKGMTVYRALTAQGINMKGILAAMHHGRVLELYETIPEEGELIPLTLAHEEGRRIYERSLRFVMLLAVRRLYPGQQVRVEYSAGHGIFVEMPGLVLGHDEIAGIREQMRLIVEDDLPFTKKTWSLAEAIRYFSEEGQPDKVALLKRRPLDYFRMYHCGDMWEYFYGAMVPSTGYVAVFDVWRQGSGFVVQLPTAEEPDRPAPYTERKQHLAIFRESAHWCDVLGVKNAADLAEMMEKGKLREFIRINEALHAKSIAAVAEDIVRQQKRVVFIAGPSSSGKTTSARRLCVQLRVLGKKPSLISLDNYYLGRDKIPLDEFGEKDFESLYALDLAGIQNDVQHLLRGETVEIPRYNFNTGAPSAEGEPLTLAEDGIIVLEGIHGLNPELSAGIPERAIYRLFVSALTCLNLDDHNRIRTTDVRLMRRIVRDKQFRGTSARETLAMWDGVRRGEEKWIFPYQEEADAMFNTALHYELPFLKHAIAASLEEIKPGQPEYVRSQRLVKILNYIPDIDPAVMDEVPPVSLLREFLGGSSFDKD